MTPIRRNTGFLAAPEARLLDRLLPLLPRSVTPDMLSGLGLAGSVLAGLGFSQVRLHPGWWLVAILGLVLNWAGDSLDGRLARHRGAGQPCRGYLLDNGLDMIGYLAVAAGFAASGLIWPALPFLALALHFMLVNLAAARLAVTGVLDLSAGAIGTTELRAIFAGGAAILAFLPIGRLAEPWIWDWMPLDLACLAWMSSMAVAVVATLRADIRLGAERDAHLAAVEAPSTATDPVMPPLTAGWASEIGPPQIAFSSQEPGSYVPGRRFP